MKVVITLRYNINLKKVVIALRYNIDLNKFVIVSRYNIDLKKVVIVLRYNIVLKKVVTVLRYNFDLKKVVIVLRYNVAKEIFQQQLVTSFAPIRSEVRGLTEDRPPRLNSGKTLRGLQKISLKMGGGGSLTV